MSRGYRFLQLFGVVLSALVLTGCAASRPIRFYLLQPLVRTSFPPRPPAGERAAVIGVGPVSIPDYLDRPQIVTRTTSNELRLAESHLWAQSLQDDFARVVTENLSVLLPADYVFALPWAGASRLQYQVTVKVIRFDSSFAGKVWLQADWSVLDGSSGKVLAMRRSNIRMTAEASDYEQLVAAQSRALAELSRQVAAVIEVL